MPIIYERLDPMPAQKLSASLASFVPNNWVPYLHALSEPLAKDMEIALPSAFHLVYFNPALPALALLPDGTDPAQSPGAPFVRRMWAGGSVQFHHRNPLLNGQLYACLEKISDVKVKGKEGEEKIFVTIERRIGPAAGNEIYDRKSLGTSGEDGFARARIIEERNIVFMRARTVSDLEEAKKNMKVLDMNREANSTTNISQAVDPRGSSRIPKFSHTLVSSPSLLFRYSALTFNAHAIHLDKSYCRDVEAHRNLLFHGPLSLTLLVTMLEGHLAETRPEYAIARFDYRNIAPLYVEEPIKLCGRQSTNDPDEYQLWIESTDGVQAVRGTATVRKITDI